MNMELSDIIKGADARTLRLFAVACARKAIDEESGGHPNLSSGWLSDVDRLLRLARAVALGEATDAERKEAFERLRLSPGENVRTPKVAIENATLCCLGHNAESAANDAAYYHEQCVWRMYRRTPDDPCWKERARASKWQKEKLARLLMQPSW